MSGNRVDLCRDYTQSPTAQSDVFVMRFSNPHTAIPDWLMLTSTIRLEARHMAAVIMILSKRGVPPSKDEIGDVIGVGARTVQRWLAELAAAGVMSYQLVGRRRMYVFHEPAGGDLDQANPDRTITDPADTDRTITDRMSITDPADTDPTVSHESIDRHRDSYGHNAMNGYFSQDSISDRPGGGGDHESIEHGSLPDTNPRTRTKVRPDQVTTETGKWLVRVGFNLTSAYRFQQIPLPTAQADYERRRGLGQQTGAIVNAWAVELPRAATVQADSGGAYGAAGLAELRAKYGDLFKLGSDTTGYESEES